MTLSGENMANHGAGGLHCGCAAPGKLAVVTSDRQGIRDGYAAHPGGVDGYYAAHGATYRNPHEHGVGPALVRLRDHWPPFGLALADPDERLLDLCCGSGEVTLALTHMMGANRLDASDPFTGAAFTRRTGRTCESWSFMDLALGCAEERRYGAVVCSFALHLCPASLLPAVTMALARITDVLVVLSPHKRPQLRSAWGWRFGHEHLDPASRIRTFGWLAGERLG